MSKKITACLKLGLAAAALTGLTGDLALADDLEDVLEGGADVMESSTGTISWFLYVAGVLITIVSLASFWNGKKNPQQFSAMWSIGGMVIGVLMVFLLVVIDFSGESLGLKDGDAVQRIEMEG